MSSVGSLLCEFRKSRRLSQLDLSTLSEVSSRHISFIESGRSNPSREMLLRLSDVLDLPLRDSNLLLSAAGFAMTYKNSKLDDVQMRPVRDALKLMLEKHNPYPALVMDSCWNAVMMNQAQIKMLSVFPQLRQLSEVAVPCEPLPGEPVNMLQILFEAEGIRPLLKNWDDLAGFLLRRLRKQVFAYNQPESKALLEQLLTMNPPKNWAQPMADHFEGPMVAAELALGEMTLKIFSTLSQFGTALDVGMEELMIESYFPADDAAKAFFEQLNT